MTEIRLQVPTSQTSKDDEIELMRKLHDALGTNSYMGSLISSELANWFETQVRNDFDCDFWAYAAQTERGLEQQVQELKQNLHEATKLCAAQQKKNDEQAVDNARLQSTVNKFETALAAANQQIYCYKGDLEGERALRERAERNIDRVQENLQLEMMKLKAQLWDQAQEIARLTKLVPTSSTEIPD